MNDKYHNVHLTTANMTLTSVHEQNIQNNKNIEVDTGQLNNEALNIEKEISINDFLEFMNVSCHLNDMIRDSSVSSSAIHINYSSSNSCPKIGNIRGNTNSITSLQHKDVLSANCSNNLSCSNIVNDYSSSYNGINSQRQRMRSEIDFKKLSRNRLVNDLYGFANFKLEKPKLIKDEQELQHQQQQHVKVEQQQILLSQPIHNEIRIDESDKFKRDGMEPKARQRLKHSTNYEEISARSSFSPLMFKKTSALHPKLYEKLEFVINEGILDGVLPYICPTIVSNSALTTRSFKGKNNKLTYQSGSVLTAILNPPADPMIQMNEQLNSNHAEIQTMKATSQTSLRRKSISRTQNQSTIDNKGTEVVIHVVDEVKNSTKDFTCPQTLLIEKMRYFADVTIGQKLDDMDISVHCDIQIFDWLMRWVKHSANIEHPSSLSCCSLSSSSGCDTGPQLDSCNVVPILVSANFLQMEPLLLDCLSYCHAHLSEVVRMSTSLSCLNDAIITRLAAMFTNIELESVRDKKDRVTPRLWTKLIMSLCEPETEALRGHYYSLAGLFRCSKCGKCLTNTIKSYINCVPNNIRLNRWGQLVNHHVRDNNWEINVYIAQLFRELKSWRRVYWKLWGHCHFMYCCVCETHFPVYQMTWCRYHPDNAVYLGSQVEGRLSGPKGRYPCCSQQAFLYDPMPGPNGCQFREHSVLVSTDRERAILAIAKLFTEGNVLCECPSLRLREAVAVNDIEPRWLGLCLTHTRGRPGLLPPLHPEENMSKTSRRLYRGGTLLFAESSTESDTTDSQNVTRRNTSKHIYSACGHSSSSDGCESECVACSNSQFTPYKKSKKRIGHPNDISGRHWSGDLSARSNQDHQREFEEKVMKQVVALVNKKIGFDQNLTTPISTPLGGSYVRLEADWKEKLKQRNTINNSNSNNNVSNNNSINNNMNNNNGNNTINNNNNMVGNNNSSNNTTSIVNKSGTKPKRLNTIPSTN